MAKNGGQITFGIKFEADNSGLEKIKKSFQDLRNLTPSDLLKINPSFEGDMNKARKAWKEIRNTVGEVERAVDDAFNTDLGVINVQKLNTSLKNIGIEKISTRFANAGVAGQRAFNEIAKGALTTNVKLKETNSLLDKMGNTLINTIKWNISSSVVNSFTNSIQQAWGYVKHLDSSLNDIRIVTGKSADEMDRFAEKANKAAKRLGSSTTDYTEASLIYYQQGLSDEEAAARAETTIKAANVTGQSGEAVSEQLTAVWNGYKVSAEEAELYIDKLAAVAATTASDLEELSTGMSKVASAAAIMGVDIDQLNAQLATIVSVTREAPESIGTALKTVYARMSDITAGLDGEVSLDEYTQQMEAMGIHVLDANGNLRDMGDVIEEIGGKWQSMSREQQTSLAQTIAGTRQYSRMMSLFDNWDMYEKALNTSATAAGTLNEQNEIYLESTEAHLKQLTAAKEGLFDSLLEADGINPVIDGLTTIVETLEKVVDAAGGMKGALAGVGSLFTKLFSKQIAQNIEPFISNINSAKRNAEQLQAVLKNTETFAIGKGYSTEAAEAMRQTQIEMSQYWDVMTREEIDESQSIIRQIGDITQLQTEWKEASKAAQEYFSSIKTYKISKKGNITENQSTNKLLQDADVSRGLQGLRDDAEGVGGVSKQQQAAAKATLELYEAQESAIKQMTAAQEKMNEAASQNLTVEKKIASLLENKDDLISASQQALQEELKTGLINEEQYNDAINKLEEYFNKIKEAQQRYDNASDDEKKSAKVQDYGVDAKGLKQDVSGIFSSSQQGAEGFNKVADSMRNAAGAAAALGDQQNKLNISVLKTRKTIQNITNALNVFSNVAMGFSAMGSVADTLGSPDLSGWEKAVQVMMSLSMTIPMITNLYNGLKNVQAAYNMIQVATNVNIEKEKASIALSTLAKNGNTVASEILKNTLKKEVFTRLENGEAIEEENEELLKQALLKNQDNLNNNQLAKGLDKLKGGLRKIGGLVQKGGPLKGLTSGMGAATAGAVALAAALTTVAVGVAIGIGVSKHLQNEYEEEAKAANETAKKAHEIAVAAQEEKTAIDELAASFDSLQDRYEKEEISLTKLKEDLAEAAKAYGDLALAQSLLDGSTTVEQAETQIREKQIEANEEVIETSKTDVDAQAKSIQADIWANQIKGKSRDTHEGKQTIDVGWSASSISDVLDEYDITDLGTGHIDLEEFSQALAEDGEALITALKENGSEEALMLISIAESQNERITAATESLTASQQATFDNINFTAEENIEDITTVKQYNEQAKNLAGQYIDAGVYETYDEALEAARNYLTQMDPLLGEMEGYRQMIANAIEPEIDPNVNETWKANYDTAQSWLTKMKEHFNMSEEEIIATYGSLEEGLKIYAVRAKKSYDEIEKSFNAVKNLSGDENFSWESLGGYSSYEDFIQDSWVKDGQFQESTEQALQYGFDSGKQKLYSYFTEEDWKAIMGAENMEAAIDETYAKYLDDYKENFASTHAGDYNAAATSLLEQSDYLTSSNIGNIDAYEQLIGDAELLKETFPELANEMDILMDENLVGTEEWIQALERVQGKMGAIAIDADGIYTKEEAANDKLTETTLTEQRNRGEISQEEYQQKFQGAMDYELEELGIDQEEFDAYTEAVEDLTEQYELSDEMVQRIAKDNLKLQKTVDTLASDWKEYGNVLKSGDKTNIKYAQGMGKIRESVEDMFGTDISDDFIQEHLEDIQKLAEGDLTVFDELQKAAAEDILVDIQGVTDAEQLSGEMANLNEYIQGIDLEGVEIGASLDSQPALASLADMVNQAGLSTEQMQALFDSLGFEPEIEYEKVTINSLEQARSYSHLYDANGKEIQVTSETQLGDLTDVYIPKINSSKTAYRGAPKSSISPKSSSGSGGGGSKPKEPDKKDPIDDEIDRYHDINVEIQRLQTGYDRLQKAQEKLSGADLIKNLNEQLKVLEKQKDAYAAKIELARQEQAELQNSLGAGGVTFAEDGTISNYAAALQNQENQVNAIIANYNNMTAEEQEAYKEVVEKAQEDYEKFKEEIARYDELVNSEIPEMEDAIQEFIDQQVEIQVQKFNMSVEIELDLAEAERQWNEFKKTVIDGIDEDDILGNAGAALNNLNVYSDPTTGEGTVSATSNHVNDILNELALMDAGQESSIYGTDRAKAIEDLKTYSDTLMEEMMNFEGEVEEIRQMYLDLIDETNEEIDKQIENYEFVTNLIEHDLNLIEKIKGEDVYAEMATYYDKQAENYKSQLEFQRQEVNLWKERMDAAKSAGNEDAYEKFKENWMEAVEQLNSTTDAALDNLMSKYENAINKIFDDLNNKVTNGMGLDYVAEEWELSNQAAERYLDTVNEAFAIDSLRNKYQTAIDESSSLTTQQKLNDLMKEEIEALEKKDKLTQYDVDRANMKYDIALKQLALEEAQQNKSQMRLRRDSQGNYTYQFVSDEDQMAQAQQELAKAQNSLYNFDKERYQANLDEMLSIYTEFTERMAEASLIIDDEERLARQVMLREKYGEIINGIVADNETVKLNLQDSAFTELAGIYDVNTENYKNMTQEQKDLVMSDLIPAWQEGAQAMVDAFSGPGGFEETVSSTFEELDLATQDYVEGLDAIGEAAGVNFDQVIDGIDETIDTMDGIIDGNEDIIEQYDEQLDQMEDILDLLDDMISKYQKVKNEAIAASQASYAYQQAEAKKQAEKLAKKTATTSSTSSNTSSTSSSGSSNSTSSGTSGGSNGNGGNNSKNGSYNSGKKSDIYTYVGKSKAMVFKEDKLVGDRYSYVGAVKKRPPFTTYKTGGYTGEWAGGSEEKNGKLAMLHQKELVLNEQDTSNVLTAIQILRGMSGVLETMTGRLASLDSGFSMSTGSMGEIIQEIIINAEFPDATDRTEIQAAFENLIGRASQYAFNTEK